MLIKDTMTAHGIFISNIDHEKMSLQIEATGLEKRGGHSPIPHVVDIEGLSNTLSTFPNL